MATKRRQSSTYSDDLSRYEFVDYTSVSNFEKFVSTIEEMLYSWGVKDGSFGIFSREQLQNHGAAISHPSAQEFSRRETLFMGEEAFQLNYFCRPNSSNHKEEEEELPLAGNNFYQLGHQQHHPLHRWTGRDKLLILRPSNDSITKKLFNAGGRATVDIYQAKHLLSACAIAFQNVGCNVPIFVPVGHSRYEMYIGYMLNSNTANALSETEVRFNASLTIPPSSQLSYLDGLKTLFLQKLSTRYENYGRLPDKVNANVWISAVYTYNLKNWFDEYWKEWDEGKVAMIAKRRSSFSDDFETWGDDDDIDVEGDSNIQLDQQLKNQHITEEVHQRRLQFGSFNDPLRTLTLSAIFPLSQEKLFDDAYQTNMDALTAKQWQISRELAPSNQQRAYLSTLVEQTIDSWIKDPLNREYLAPYDNNNDDSTIDSISLMRNLFVPGNNNLNLNNVNTGDTQQQQRQQQQVSFFKSDQVDNVINALFHSTMPTLKNEDNEVLESRVKHSSTKKLGLRFQTNSSVPHRSLLWNLLLYCLEEVSSTTNENNGKKQNISNFIGFLKIVWLEVLRKIRWHWENLIPIPNLSPYLYDSANLKPNEYQSKAFGIDLRYNILHQKVSMVNCCILRKLQSAPQNGKMGDHKAKLKENVGKLFDSVSSNHEQPRKKSKASKFQSLIEKFVDGVASESGVADDSVSFDPSDIEDIGSEDSDVFLDAIEDGSVVSNDSPTNDNREDTKYKHYSLTGDRETVIPNKSMTESFVSLPYIPSDNSTEEVEAEAASINDPNVAEGQSHTHESLKLLKSGEPMQIPITQDPGFMTEDMIAEQADVFESLGTSENATHQRAKLQSAQLYSDMQAFKAANPYACLEDFVRWHSPRDWILDTEREETEVGRLSTRMSEPSNIWQELWKCSRRIPCSRQKPLFDINVEAEKALYFLETTSVHELFSIMLPTLGLIAYDTLSSHPIVKYSKHVSNGLIRLGSELIDSPWDDLRHGKATFENLISSIRQQESTMCHAISLLRKLPGQYDLVDQLLFNDQAIVKEGDERSSVFQLFKNDQGIISQPSSREYVLYSDCKELTTDDRVLPQRQYAIVKDNEIRIFDMQTADALYA